MSETSDLSGEARRANADRAARLHAVDPAKNVVLEASAGTGKTRVLVERYVNLLRAGVDPDHILAITFTRKAAAEMRDRIIERLREASRLSEIDRGRWRELKERLGEIGVSTIDAFCLSLLREFPLEADVDPGFDLADDTEAPRLIAESLDQALRICRAMARESDDVALVFAQLGERRLRSGLSALLDRRLVAPAALKRYLARGPRDLTAARACEDAARRVMESLTSAPGGLNAFLADGPVHHPHFSMLADDLRRMSAAARVSGPSVEPGSAVLDPATPEGQAWFRHLVDRLRGYFMTQDGRPRGEKFLGTPFKAEHCAGDAAWKRHRTAAGRIAPVVADAIRAFRRDLNVVMSRGVWRIFSVALERYQRTLESHALLDFSGVLERAIRLLKDLDEFGQTRFQLEARYRHVLVDEFQDTSRAQWDLIAQLVRSWGEGFGAAADALPPSIFIVGDRKQSIYGFRDADAAVLDDAGTFIEGLRPEGDPRRAIAVSFRSAQEILSFVNDVFMAIEKAPERRDAFRYEDSDRFPIAPAEAEPVEQASPGEDVQGQQGLPFGVEDEESPEPALSIIAGDSMTATAERVGAEIERIVGHVTIRDRRSGLRRPAQPADIAILFRSRDAHREFEKALERRHISAYVYKGLGFFDADEVQDAVALLRYLADPLSDLRAAAFLRSRVVRVSDRALALLRSPGLAVMLVDPAAALPAALEDDDRRVLALLRASLPEWLGLADRITPSDLLHRLLTETGYLSEIEGPRHRQARENLKKLGAMIRRFQNRGYATLARLTDHLEGLAVGDESNAAIDAEDSVSLMTVHASKGLEFPIVFVVNMNRGTGTSRAPIRVAASADGESSVAIADYQSEADEDSSARDREETKRLLYVALTRARDRVCLAGSVASGAFRPTRGSLGEILPAELRALFIQAADGSGALTWTAPGGQSHILAIR
jgi:ATP-dependent helicase/nuclease subunit A